MWALGVRVSDLGKAHGRSKACTANALAFLPWRGCLGCTCHNNGKVGGRFSAILLKIRQRLLCRSIGLKLNGLADRAINSTFPCPGTYGTYDPRSNMHY